MRPKTRHPDGQNFLVWLNPLELDILARYQAYKELPSRAAAARAALRHVGHWLERQEQKEYERDRRQMGHFAPIEEDDEEPRELRAAREVSQGDSD